MWSVLGQQGLDMLACRFQLCWVQPPDPVLPDYGTSWSLAPGFLTSSYPVEGPHSQEWDKSRKGVSSGGTPVPSVWASASSLDSVFYQGHKR